MSGSRIDDLAVLGIIALAAVLIFAIALWNPAARRRRAEARRLREEKHELRLRLMVNARATYDKQFPRAGRRRTTGGYHASSGSSSWSWSGGDSGGFGGDSGGGGGDGGGGGC
jgi:uncharacterized membrane protein YgcG